MNSDEARQTVTLLNDQGFIVEWIDAKAELFLVRAIPARAA